MHKLLCYIIKKRRNVRWRLHAHSDVSSFHDSCQNDDEIIVYAYMDRWSKVMII